MGNIVLLDELTINKIAAGEVIERPASVVKELVENSIDAGAKNITVEIKNGGISLIKVTDDGCGMAEDDMEIAFERHATSKIRQASDLETVQTMGFRGEALASIASIANVELISKREEDETAHKIVIEGEKVLEKSEVGAGKGTTITVTNLFFNTPVRYKFLKKDFTEAGYIEDAVTRIALVNKDVAIKLINSGKTVIQTNGNGDFKSIVYSIYGKDIANGIIDVDYTFEDIRVTGVVGKPEISRNTRVYQQFFVNNRYIKDKNLSAAADQAYKGVVPGGKHGFIILNLEMDPSKVDVNVHPAKLEVRFEEEGKVFKAVYHAIKSGLAKAENIEDVDKIGKTIDDGNKVVEEAEPSKKGKYGSHSLEADSTEKDKSFSGLFKNILKEPEETKEEIENNNLRDIFEYRQNAKESVFGKGDFVDLDENEKENNLDKDGKENNNEDNNDNEESDKPEDVKSQENNDNVNFGKELTDDELERRFAEAEKKVEKELAEKQKGESTDKNAIDDFDSKIDSKINETENITDEKPEDDDVKTIKIGDTLVSSDTREMNFDVEAALKDATVVIDSTKSMITSGDEKTEIVGNIKEVNTLKNDENKEASDIADEEKEDNSDVEPKEENENIDNVTEKILKMKAEEGLDDTQFVDTGKVRETLKENSEPVTPEFANMYKEVFGTDVQDVRRTKEEEEAKINGSSYLQYANPENENVFDEKETYVPEVKYKFVGIVFDTYIIISIEDEMFMIDQHAAHERIMYEKVKENYYREENKDSQMLLMADVITMSHKEMEIAKENIDMFRKAGFDFEEFGENTIKLTAVPSMCEQLNTKKLFLEILDEIDTVAVTAKQEKEDKFIATVACKAAVKGKMKLDEKEVTSLMDELLSLPNPFSCPHGRPTAIKITRADIEKKFSRR